MSSARGVAAACLLLAALGVAASHPEVSRGPTLLRKCCPLRQRLSPTLDGCEDADADAKADAPHAPDAPAAPKEETVAEALRRDPGGYPFWMSNSTPVYDPVTKEPLPPGGLLSLQKPHLVLRYGPAPPCARRRAKVFHAASAKRFHLLADGTLLLRTDAAEEPSLPLAPADYCSDRVRTAADDAGQLVHVFLTCPCNKTLCINKCCNRRQSHVIRESRRHVSYTCEEASAASRRLPAWLPRFVEAGPSGLVEHVLLDANPPSCAAGSVAVLLNTRAGQRPKAIRVFPNGSALLEGFSRSGALAADQWCGDWAQLAAPSEGEEQSRVESALFCARARPPPAAAAAAAVGRPLLYGALFAVSALFLALTLAAYALLPELRRAAHAAPLLSHVAALLVGSVALASGQLRGLVGELECYLMGFVIQYSMLATFFWLNVLSFDIAYAFKRGERCAALRGRRSYLWYSLYAWGGPALISAVTIALQFADGLPDDVLRPDIGLTSCWFHEPSAGWAFFYGPLALLLAANALLWAAAAAHLLGCGGRRGGGGGGGGGDGGERRPPLLRAAGTAAALFVLTGVSWLCEVASFADGSDSLIWTVMDVVNILRGLFIFVLLCCRPKVARLVRKRLCPGTMSASSEGRSSTYSALQMSSVVLPADTNAHAPTPTANGRALSHAQRLP